MSFGGFEFGPKPDVWCECSWTNYISSDYFSRSQCSIIKGRGPSKTPSQLPRGSSLFFVSNPRSVSRAVPWPSRGALGLQECVLMRSGGGSPDPPKGKFLVFRNNIQKINTLIEILKVVGQRQAATAIRTTFPGGPKSQKPMDGRQKPFCGENKVD